MIRLILIRHGRTAWNLPEGQAQRFRGLVDLPLADEGVIQAQVTARRLAQLPIDAVYSSPLQRAARTAEIIAEPHGLAVQTLPGLRSMSFGDWAGLSVEEVARRWPDLYRQWHYDPFGIRAPGGESPADLRERAVDAVHQALSRHPDAATIVLIGHEIVCRTLTCALGGLPNPSYWLIRQDLCNLSRFDYDPHSGRFTVVGLNDTCHLDPALPRRADGGARLILIRHGQTAWNEALGPQRDGGAGEERFRGRTDLPLDGVGHAQAQAVAARLRDEPLAALYASPLLRARQTLTPLAEAVGLPVRPHDGLIDINYGRFQGLTHAEAAAAFPDEYSLWRTSPGRVCFPGGESLPAVRARLAALLDELAARHPGQTVAMVGHQMVNKVAACTLLGLDLDQIGRIQQDTCALDVLQQVGSAWHTLRLNDTCHLEPGYGPTV